VDKFWEIFTLGFILIAIFLFLDKGSATIGIVNSLAGNTVAGIRTLQGR
jgi:hypothetical protein